MLKILMLKGLPASGKSTWAKNLVNENSNYKRINKDDLRAMLDTGKHSKTNEKFVLKTRDWLIREAILAQKSVIVDDTNFHPMHEKRLQELAKSLEAEIGKSIQFEVKIFDVPLEECIRRDLQRPNSVGEAVIRRMYKDWKNTSFDKKIKTAVIPYRTQDKSLPHAVICDIDGTLAMMNGRSPFDMNRVGEDLPNVPVIELIQDLAEKYQIILLSGRETIGKEQTKQWLEKHQIPYHKLLMRRANDHRKDALIKREIVENQILPKYYIRFVLDDRNQVVDMWRQELQLPCFQVFYGEF